MPFVDHYELLGGSPDTPFAELKKLYHEKLREFHPDKRPNSATGVGVRVTSSLNEAWEILQDAAKKEAYDQLWKLHKIPPPDPRGPAPPRPEGRNRSTSRPRAEGTTTAPDSGPTPPADIRSPAERAEAKRREGNELYKEAQAIYKSAGAESLSAAAVALTKYQAAIVKYTEGLELAPQDYRIRSNRALCYAALKDWGRCREDAQMVIHLKGDFMKGWFLLCKSLWKEGSVLAAQKHLDMALGILPDSQELLALREEMAPDIEALAREASKDEVRLPRMGRAAVSRNVSPANTPIQGQSRTATPPRANSRSPIRPPRNPYAEGFFPGQPAPAPYPGSFDDTAQFGDRTANFGHVYQRPPKGRSPSPAASNLPPVDSRYENTFGAPPPIPGQVPRPSEQPRPGHVSLSGMVASSRIGVGR